MPRAPFTARPSPSTDSPDTGESDRGKTLRLDKYVHDSAGLTRKLAKQAVRRGRVSVDGTQVRDPSSKIGTAYVVRLDGVALDRPAPRYLMMNKPQGCICATSDPHQRTVLELLPPEYGEGLTIAGRLDIDTTGLLLLSEDGQWIHRVTSPRHGHRKTYRASLAEPLVASAESRFERGIYLKNDKRRTLPAELVRLSDSEVRITLAEGRYHQVKRMFAAVGNHVTALHREQIGDLSLDADLASGGFRELSRKEIELF